jgi:hypothetical protein
MPPDGSSATAYGYGGITRDDRDPRTNGAGVKRYCDFTWDRATNHGVLVQGDSGGPVLDGDGAVFAVNSGYYTLNGDDLHAYVALLRDEIEDVISRWRRE